MKILLYFFPAALCVASALPLQGVSHESRIAGKTLPADTIGPEEEGSFYEDSVTVDTAFEGTGFGDSILTTDYEETDWAGEESGAADAAEAPAEEICPQDYELLGEFNEKSADYSLTHPQDANHAVTFNAMVYSPMETKRTGGYTQMVGRVLTGTISSPVNKDNWKGKDIEDMLEAKWKLLKEAYNAEVKEGFMGDFTFRTNVTPAWQWKSHGTLTTYLIEDEVYQGGAHGMCYTYYLTLAGAEERPAGLTDLFKEESLPAVFALVEKKLRQRPNVPAEDSWPQTASLPDDLSPDDYGVRTGQKELYRGKWYPRPALTGCGVVFTYFPYEKDCYAAGHIHILLPYEEIADFLKINP